VMRGGGEKWYNNIGSWRDEVAVPNCILFLDNGDTQVLLS